MKTIKNYNDFLNESLFSDIKDKLKQKFGKGSDKNTETQEVQEDGEDDELFSSIFNRIKENFNIDNLDLFDDIKTGWKGWEYLFDEFEVKMLFRPTYMGPNVYVDNVPLVISEKLFLEVRTFFHTEHSNYNNENTTNTKNEMKNEISSNKNISDDELGDIIFNKIKEQTDTKLPLAETPVILWEDKPNRGPGYSLKVDDFYNLHFISNRSERGGTYPNDNMFINNVGFQIDITKFEEIVKYLEGIVKEIETNKHNLLKDKLKNKLNK